MMQYWTMKDGFGFPVAVPVSAINLVRVVEIADDEDGTVWSIEVCHGNEDQSSWSPDFRTMKLARAAFNEIITSTQQVVDVEKISKIWAADI